MIEVEENKCVERKGWIFCVTNEVDNKRRKVKSSVYE